MIAYLAVDVGGPSLVFRQFERGIGFGKYTFGREEEALEIGSGHEIADPEQGVYPGDDSAIPSDRPEGRIFEGQQRRDAGFHVVIMVLSGQQPDYLAVGRRSPMPGTDQRRRQQLPCILGVPCPSGRPDSRNC